MVDDRAKQPVSTARGALLVSVGILASRLAGFVRQRVLAHYLGTSDAADALLAAFRLGNIAQNLLGDGTLSASFVPIYSRLRARSQEQATSVARAVLGALLVLVAIVSAAGTLLAPTLADVIASGFAGDKRQLTIELVRVLFPMTGLLVIGAWALGILTAHRRFLVPYAAPVLWSAAQIAAVVGAALSGSAEHATLARAAAWGAVAGALLQLVVLGWPSRKLLGRIAPSLQLGQPEVREVAAKLPSAILGRGVLQLSGLVDTALAGLVGAGAIATLNYAQTLYLLPMSVLGTGEAAASLPELSERSGDAGSEARQAMRTSLGRSLTRVFSLSAGAAVAIGPLSPEIVTLLLRGGRFDESATTAVATVLAAYAAGLPANAASRVLATGCFAVGDTSRPARFATARVVVSTAGSLVLMRWYGVAGVVGGAVFAAWVELALLESRVRHHLGGSALSSVPMGRIALAGACCTGVGFGSRWLSQVLSLGPVTGSAVVLALAGGSFVLAASALKLVSVQSLRNRQ